jgi:hypothetical protein
VRDIPDVSLFAANGVWNHYYVVCWSRTGYGGIACTGDPSEWPGGGGTSFASPIMAGIQALVNQYTGSRQGNPNPTYYSLAKTEYGSSGDASCNSTLGNGVAGSCIFYDVTEGDMDVPCTGTNECYTPSGTYGVLSTSNSAYQPAYGTQTGWDFATGIGTVNAYNLVMAFGTSPPPTPTTLSAAPATINLGSVDATGTSKPKKVALTNKGTTAALIESVTAPPPFAIAGGKDTCSGQSIEPKKKCSFEVEFAPATPGAVSDQTIEVGYNGGSPAMSLSGTGIAVTLKAPKSESFTAVDAGVTGKAKNIELSNSSTVPVTLETAALGAPDPGSFTISSDGCSGQVLAPKGKCTVAVEFAPPGSASGTQTSTLSFGFTYGANSGSVSTALKSKVK